MDIKDMTFDDLKDKLTLYFMPRDECSKQHEQIAAEMKEMKAIATESRDKIDDVKKGIRLVKTLVTAVPAILAFLEWLSRHCSL